MASSLSLLLAATFHLRLRAESVSAALASPSVRPTTFGTATLPFDTQMVTEAPRSTDVPSFGSMRVTVFSGCDEFSVLISTAKPFFWSSCR